MHACWGQQDLEQAGPPLLILCIWVTNMSPADDRTFGVRDAVASSEGRTRNAASHVIQVYNHSVVDTWYIITKG